MSSDAKGKAVYLAQGLLLILIFSFFALPVIALCLHFPKSFHIGHVASVLLFFFR